MSRASDKLEGNLDECIGLLDNRTRARLQRGRRRSRIIWSLMMVLLALLVYAIDAERSWVKLERHWTMVSLSCQAT